MQLGHVAVALTIASFAPELTGGQVEALSLEAILVALIAHEFPNFDGLVIMAKLAPKKFHCTWSHSLIVGFLAGLVTWFINPSWGYIFWMSIFLHYLADMPSSVGLPLFMPFSYKRYTFNLWADTGYFGWVSFKGTYEQAWTWILEGGAYVVLLVRLYQLRFWPFS